MSPAIFDSTTTLKIFLPAFPYISNHISIPYDDVPPSGSETRGDRPTDEATQRETKTEMENTDNFNEYEALEQASKNNRLR